MNLISIAAEIERAEPWTPFRFLEWNDEWLSNEFRKCLREAKPKAKEYESFGYRIYEITVDEDLLRRELERRNINANEAVMIAMDALKTFGSIRIAH